MSNMRQFWKDNPQYDGLYKEPSMYVISFEIGASQRNVSSDFTTASDSDFIVTSAFGTQTTAVTNAAYIQTPLIASLVQQSKTRNFANVPAVWDTFIATLLTYTPASFWNYPMVLPPTSQLIMTFTNPIATAANVWVGFNGIKVFPWTAASMIGRGGSVVSNMGG